MNRLYRIAFCGFALCSLLPAAAQDNSPYSRYGLGDIVPNTNIINRGMGSISAAYADFLAINYNNPASYSKFRLNAEPRSGQTINGRVLFDVGINMTSRTLRNPNRPEKFTSASPTFSHVQFGIPLKRNWGLSFGLRQLTRVAYKINRTELLKDPIDNENIDSALTQFTGTGGTYLPSFGTGFSLGNFSAGANLGYLFGRRELSTKRAFINDSVQYASANFVNSASFGGLFLQGGLQYDLYLSGNRESKENTILRLGVSGNLNQDINGSREVIRETFVRDANGVDQRVDSIYENTNDEGTVTYPSSMTAGVVLQRQRDPNDRSGWLLGVDFVQHNWENFRYFGTTDPSVQNGYELRVGGQIRPAAGPSLLSRSAYRAGFSIGRDYIRDGSELPLFTASFGLEFPIGLYNRMSLGQYSTINLSLEYLKRGNNDNQLKENAFRLSLGLNFSDLWFNKRRYD
ncbi:MAG TPA: hypothetical protein VHK69_11925 [Chitinophagaceae bacterium]|jgi:hypothetical protein|nr:hypothetical protein [Chitinophagaceae bacterium]